MNSARGRGIVFVDVFLVISGCLTHLNSNMGCFTWCFEPSVCWDDTAYKTHWRKERNDLAGTRRGIACPPHLLTGDHKSASFFGFVFVENLPSLAFTGQASSLLYSCGLSCDLWGNSSLALSHLVSQIGYVGVRNPLCFYTSSPGVTGCSPGPWESSHLPGWQGARLHREMDSPALW